MRQQPPEHHGSYMLLSVQYLPLDGGSMNVGPFTVITISEVTSDKVLITDLRLVCQVKHCVVGTPPEWRPATV